MKFPVVISCPQGTFFRRIQPDGFIEKKRLGMDWEPAPDGDGNPFIPITRIQGYIATMTEKLRWKKS